MKKAVSYLLALVASTILVGCLMQDETALDVSDHESMLSVPAETPPISAEQSGSRASDEVGIELECWGGNFYDCPEFNCHHQCDQWGSQCAGTPGCEPDFCFEWEYACHYCCVFGGPP